MSALKLSDCQTVEQVVSVVGVELQCLRDAANTDSDLVSAHIDNIESAIYNLWDRFKELENAHNALSRRVDRIQGIE